jgi:hypothetical protein
MAAVSVSCVLLVACTAPVSPASGGAGTGASPVGSSSSTAPGTVTLHGVSVALPGGWSEGTPTVCGHVVEHTVTVYTGAPVVAPCPTTATPPKEVEAISLVEVFGSWGAMPWTGTTATWDGQPVWVTEYDRVGAPVTLCPSPSDITAPCGSEPPADAVVTATLALPWLNASVVVHGATAARAQELLGQVSFHVQSVMAVPGAASRMSVVRASPYQRPSSSTSPSVIEQTLSALRTLPSLPGAAACELPVTLGPIVAGRVVTFDSDGTETSFLVASSPCDQVTSGTGTAGHAGAALDTALAKVPLPALG